VADAPDIVLSYVYWKENTGGYRAKQSGIPEYLYISPTEIKPKIPKATRARQPAADMSRAIH